MRDQSRPVADEDNHEDRGPSISAGWLRQARRLLAEADDADTPVNVARLTNLVTGMLRGDRGTFISFDDIATIVHTTDNPQMIGVKLDLGRYPEILAAVDGGVLVSVDDAHEDERLAAVRGFLPADLGSIVVIPVRHGSVTRGVIVVRTEKPRTLPASLRELAWFTVAALAHLAIPDEAPLFRGVHLHAERLPAVAGQGGGTAPAPVEQRILVVEDDNDCREAMVTLLTDSGYRVESAADGRHALELANSYRPTLVLLDVRLPDMTGYEVARKLKSDRHVSHCGILFLSGVQNLPADLLQAGLNDADFLRKPYDVDDLMARVARAMREATEQSSLHALANTDQLTGLGNLRLLEERLAVEASRIARYKTTLTIMVADMDGLKDINDRYGHLTGSKAIRAVGSTIASEIRHTDVAARYGGDEFIVIMPHTTVEEGVKLADRIRTRLQSVRPGGAALTISVGLAAFDARVDRTLEDVIARADAATYQAKQQGRDCVVTDHPAGTRWSGDRERKPRQPRPT